MASKWTNWSGGVTCRPWRIESPTTEGAIAALVREAAAAGRDVRVAGTGHSFTPVCATDGLLLSLDGWQGIESIDAGQMAVTIRAGAKLWQLGEPLRRAGVAMANMGDIDRQALAGAVSTGTHGTGRSLGCISTQVIGLRLVTAAGEIVTCSAEVEPELFTAARVAVGALGVLTAITLRVLPAYRLHERTWVEPFEACLARLDEHISATRHFEFFWSPHEDACAMKALHPTTLDAAPTTPPPTAEGRMARYVGPERVDWSDRILPSERTLKFNEQEFSVPAEHGPACMRAIRALMLTRYPDVVWPVEYRTLAADDIPLSMASGRPTVTISIHQDAALPHAAFFADAEAIFREFGGRPHWGKLHDHTARDLRALYPRWNEFQAVRERLDPAGRCLNEHLRRVLLD